MFLYVSIELNKKVSNKGFVNNYEYMLSSLEDVDLGFSKVFTYFD